MFDENVLLKNIFFSKDKEEEGCDLDIEITVLMQKAD